MSPFLSALLLSLSATPPAAASEPLCARREPCRLLETLPAGQDAAGQSLQVKHLSLGWMNAEAARDAMNRAFGPGREAEGSRAGGACEAAEWWLLRSGQPAQLLLTVCNDGYGPAGVGTDEVKVGDNLFTYAQSGQSNKRWGFSSTLRLSPLALLGSGQWSAPVETPDRKRGHVWDVARLRGEEFVPAATCPAGQAGATEARALPYVPLIQVDKAYLRGGWKTAGLGTCALEAESLVLGTRKDAQDARLKVVLAERETLLLEVRDDRWTGPSAKWLNDDHVELWLGPKVPQELTGCGEPLPDQRALQWGIRLVDGQVFPGAGNPKQKLSVEKVELREPSGIVGYRLKVGLPKGFRGLAVIYSDSDEGKKQERMLATGPVKFARPETVNAVRLVLPEEATCAVRGGELAVEPTPLKVQGPDVAALTAP